MKEKIVLIGAGSAMFTRGLVADLIRGGREVDLALVDIDPEDLQVAEHLTQKMVAAGNNAPISIRASTDRRAVLPGATAVICTVGVGGRRAWEQDVFIPRKYGIYMPVGDTVGPGGTSRALRMIPAMVAIAQDVLELAPTALFFNYGNPMAPVCRAVHKVTGANMVGLCHGVNGTAGYLAHELGVGRSDLQYNAIGINHLTWFTSLRVHGVDAMPRLHQIAARKLARVPASDALPGEVIQWTRTDNPYGNDVEPFSWKLFQLFGTFPAPMDRHVTEFFPQFFRDGQYYGMKLGVDAFTFEGTIRDGDRIYAEMKSAASSPDPLAKGYLDQFRGEHEQVMEIIASIRGDQGKVYSANLPNSGQVPNLPMDAIIESPAVADSEGLHPIAQKPLPPGLAGTLATRYQWVETTVEAALEGSRDKFIQALVLDGAAHTLEQAVSLADELLSTQAHYLPQFTLP